MSKRNLKTLLALLLAACMLLSGIGAFAAPTVQVTEPAPGEAVVDITGTVSGTDKGMDALDLSGKQQIINTITKRFIMINRWKIFL